MTGKIVLNVVYNLAIFAFGMCAIWGFKHDYYLITLAFGAAIALVIYLKMRLIKQVREFAKNKKK